MPDIPGPPGPPRGEAKPTSASAQPSSSAARDARSRPANADAFLCDRCNAEMYRMHAVWRCPECGYKTDCCGW